MKFEGLIHRYQPLAAVGYALTTPMHFDMLLNGLVKEYNARAIELLNLPMANNYEAIVAVCGTPPYRASKLAPNATHSCSLINDNEEYHYNTAGYTALARNVARLFREILRGSKVGVMVPPQPPPPGGSYCEDSVTFCPDSWTCSVDKYSNSGYGCCPTRGAVSCGDSWHCCKRGARCVTNGTNYSHLCV